VDFTTLTLMLLLCRLVCAVWRATFSVSCWFNSTHSWYSADGSQPKALWQNLWSRLKTDEPVRLIWLPIDRCPAYIVY